MNAEEFRIHGKNAIDYIVNYLENIRDRPVLPSVEPGYLQNLLPKEAPEEPEKWEEIIKDMERFIMPGVSFQIKKFRSSCTMCIFRFFLNHPNTHQKSSS